MRVIRKAVDYEKGDDIEIKIRLGKNGRPIIEAKVIPDQRRRRPLSDARATTLLKVPLPDCSEGESGGPIYTPYTFEQIKNYDLSNDKLHSTITFVRNIVNLYIANGGDTSLL